MAANQLEEFTFMDQGALKENMVLLEGRPYEITFDRPQGVKFQPQRWIRDFQKRAFKIELGPLWEKPALNTNWVHCKVEARIFLEWEGKRAEESYLEMSPGEMKREICGMFDQYHEGKGFVPDYTLIDEQGNYPRYNKFAEMLKKLKQQE